MQQKLIMPLILVGLGILFLGFGCGSYNSMVNLDEEVAQAWGSVQTQYQRRADLVENLVATVKGAANFEQETLTQVVEARSKATSIQLDADDLSPEKLQQFQEAQSQLSQSLGRLLLITENYPQLQATQAFRDLSAQLEGTENRVSVARDRFNQAVTVYNKKVRSFPSSLFAGVFGFSRKGQFEADKGSQNAPKVNFD